MRHDLRRGSSSVYLQYESSSGDTIGADQFEAALDGNAVVIRFCLKPVDENQRLDERRLNSEALTEVHISDEHIINNLIQFLNHKLVTAQEMRLQILSQGETIDYIVVLGAAGLNFLPLMVQRVAN